MSANCLPAKKKSDEKKRSKATTESKSVTQRQKESMVEAPAKKEKDPKKSRLKTAVRKDKKKTSTGQKQKTKTTSSSTDGGDVPSGGEDKSIDKRTQKEVLVVSERKKKKKESVSVSKKEFNMEMAQKFFRMMDSQKVSNTRVYDALFDTMPESSQMRSDRDTGSNEKDKKKKKRRKKKTEKEKKEEEEEKHKIFKENGEPVWVVQEVEVIGKDGEKVKNPVLMAALEEDGTEIQEGWGKGWAKMVPRYLVGEFDDGKRDAPPPSGPFHSRKHYETREQEYFQDRSIQYNTCSSVHALYGNRLEQFMNADDEPHEDRRTLREQKKKKCQEKLDHEEMTCIDQRETSVTFDMKKSFMCIYDRRKPLASVAKCRKKAEKLSREKAEKEKKENNKSREAH